MNNQNQNTEEYWNKFLTIEHRKPEVIKILMKITEEYFAHVDALKVLTYDNKSHFDDYYRSYRKALRIINTFTPYKIEGVIENWNRMTKNHTDFNSNFNSLCVNITIMENTVDGELYFNKALF